MSELGFVTLVLLPIGLGLVGFLEPCSMGSNLLFTKYMEGRDRAAKLVQIGVFTVTRALFIGSLGLLAGLLGTAFLGVQKGIWIAMGSVYVLIGAVYVLGKAGVLMRTFGPRVSRISAGHGSAGLGVLFGLNIPACAAPLIFVLLGTATASTSAGGASASGFVSLGLFGLALALPLVLAVSFEPAGRALDRLAALSVRLPKWTGAVFLLLGLWSIYFGLFVNLADWV